MWILLKSVNDYNQHGDYFEAAWPIKPTKDDLIMHLQPYIALDSLDEVFAENFIKKLLDEQEVCYDHFNHFRLTEYI